MAKSLAEFLQIKFAPKPGDYEYAAALMDGEGTIGISRSRPSGSERCTQYLVRLSVEMGDREPVLFMKNLFGGHLFSRFRKEHTREMHSWVCSSQMAKPVLEKLLPFLKIGRKQRAAMACLEALKTKTIARKLGVPPEILARRETLYQICREANWRGRTPY